ncbi:uncharacterized protein LOC142587094 [Dermacentor variabilis]|uniref:uncharacterized protein LOC142587094 n=1 Tax=Dermacentor variabilis TaxID=34621 RepID=UPI003F5C3190
MRGTAKKACYHKANQATANSIQLLASGHAAMRCYVVALCSALLTLLAVSPTVAGPCPLPACQQPRQPVCPSPGNSCGCRCNNSGSPVQPGSSGGGYTSSQPGPCGGGAAYAPGQGPTISGALTHTDSSICQIPLCSSGFPAVCLRYDRFGKGCDCKCATSWMSCGNNSPFGVYVCMHTCAMEGTACICKCVADPPFKAPPSKPCQPITG